MVPVPAGLILAGLICFLGLSLNAGAQLPYDTAYAGEAQNCRESITLFTDRSMYAVNEPIRFRSFCRTEGIQDGFFLSRVLYVELVTPAGSPVATGKFPHGEEGSSGQLLIPENARTGNYYLRAYTRWMRNFGPQSYAYIPLTIINPYSSDILEAGNGISGSRPDRYRMIRGTLQCGTDRTSYSPGEEVRLDLTPSPARNTGPLQYCVTVVPEGLADTLYAQVSPDLPGTNPEFRFDYQPDIRGVSISGSVVQSGNGPPVSRSRLHFSVLGRNPGYFTGFTDEMGRFVLTLPPRTGIRELFVACEVTDEITPEILIDRDFETDPIPFGRESFSLPPGGRKAAEKIALNMQLSQAFRTDREDDSPVRDPDPGLDTSSFIPFYGTPKSVILIDEFVDLPNMTEVFENLVMDVSVYYRRGEPHFRVLGEYTYPDIFPPLILVDGIPVFDQKAVLAMNPQKIERIEVINEIYVKGDVLFGGIVLFTSREGDMAAVDLPDGSYFFDYQCFHPGSTEISGIPAASRPGLRDASRPDSRSPDTRKGRIPDSRNGQTPASRKGRIPDTRNTLLWIDNLTLEEVEQKSLRFEAAHTAGKYCILVRGVSPQGEIICGSCSFRVREN